MVEFVIFGLPALVYVLVQSRGEGRTLRSAFDRLDAKWGNASAYRWALVLLIPLLSTSWLALTLIPAEILGAPGVSIARLTSFGATIGVILRVYRRWTTTRLT